MAFFNSRGASLAAVAAAFSMSVPAAHAAPLHNPVPVAQGWSVEGETVHHDHWGGGYGGWGGGYGGWGRHHHHDGIDGGDVLAGVLIIGGIAAIAAAASNHQNRTVETDPNGYPYRTQRDHDRDIYYRDRDNRDQSYQGRGLDNAADICAREVSRRERVDEVTSVDRGASGWHVEGRLASGRGFTCEIDNDGQLGAVDLDARVSDAAPSNGQWNDEAYARARADQDARPGA